MDVAYQTSFLTFDTALNRLLKFQTISLYLIDESPRPYYEAKELAGF